MSLKKFVIGTIVMSFVNVVRLLAQFIAIPILSRLLSPEDYGLVAIAMPFILFAMMLADAGIGMSLVRDSAKERVLWSTCFWITILFGLALVVVMLGIAPVAALMFEQPKLMPIIMALAVVVLAHAICSIPQAALQKDHHFRMIASIEVLALIVGIGSAILIALNGGGVWALVDQQLVFFLVRVTLIFWFSSFRPLMVFDLRNVKEHLVFSHNLLWINIINFLIQVTKNFFIGKILGAAAVGLFSMTFQFVRLPLKLITGPLHYVLYSQLVKIKDNTKAIGRTYLIITRVLAILLFPSMGMVAAAHAPVFNVLLSEKWSMSGYMFMIAAPAAALQAVMAIGSVIRMTLGRTDVALRITVEFGIVWLIALLVSGSFGLEWIAVSYSVASLLYSPRSLVLVLQIIECSLTSYLKTLITPILVTLLCGFIYMKVNDIMLLSELVQVCLGGALGILGIAASAFAQRQSLRHEISYLKNVLYVGD